MSCKLILDSLRNSPHLIAVQFHTMRAVRHTVKYAPQASQTTHLGYVHLKSRPQESIDSTDALNIFSALLYRGLRICHHPSRLHSQLQWARYRSVLPRVSRGQRISLVQLYPCYVVQTGRGTETVHIRDFRRFDSRGIRRSLSKCSGEAGWDPGLSWLEMDVHRR